MLREMKFLRLLNHRPENSASLVQPLRLSPPWSLRVIEGHSGADRKPAVRFSTRLRPRGR
jgi:hypothetical protein